MSNGEMDRAHRADSTDQRRMDDLRRAMREFLADPPSRCHPRTRHLLADAAEQLHHDSDHITAVWD